MGESQGAVTQYRARFKPRGAMRAPYLIMAVTVVCGESDEHARELAAPLRVAYARLAAGRPGPFPSIEEARDYPFSAEELAVVARFAEGAVIGSAATVRAGLARLVERTSADELMISTVVPIERERVASYERLASVWGLGGAA